jgi:hypothetical protein
MRTAKVLQCATVLTTGLFLFGESHADNCSGYDVLVVQSAETTEMVKGHSLTVLRLSSIAVNTSNSASPYNLTTGECSGTMVTTPDGVTRGSGHCARRDKDGDSYNVEWALPAGAQKGTWKYFGGTGKFAASDGKMIVNKWGGTCK